MICQRSNKGATLDPEDHSAIIEPSHFLNIRVIPIIMVGLMAKQYSFGLKVGIINLFM